MRTWLKRALLVLVVLAAVMQAVRPARTNPPVDPSREITATHSVHPAVAATLERSCHDCHSNRTVWPWYSQVAPASWLLAYDVNEGRSELNFSEWNAYSPKEKQKLLGKICDEVSEGEMPGAPYSFLHPRARLSKPETQAICSWTKEAMAQTVASEAD